MYFDVKHPSASLQIKLAACEEFNPNRGDIHISLIISAALYSFLTFRNSIEKIL